MKDDHLDAFDPDQEWWTDFLIETGLSPSDGGDIDELCQRLRDWWVEYKEDRADQEAYEDELRQLAKVR